MDSRLLTMQKSRYPVRVSALLVPVAGLEPARCRQRRILSPEEYLEGRGNRWNLPEPCGSKKAVIATPFCLFSVAYLQERLLQIFDPLVEI